MGGQSLAGAERVVGVEPPIPGEGGKVCNRRSAAYRWRPGLSAKMPLNRPLTGAPPPPIRRGFPGAGRRRPIAKSRMKLRAIGKG